MPSKFGNWVKQSSSFFIVQPLVCKCTWCVSKREIITCSVSNPLEYFYDHVLVDFMQGQKVPAF